MFHFAQGESSGYNHPRKKTPKKKFNKLLNNAVRRFYFKLQF